MGHFFVYIAFFTCLISTVLYFLVSRGNERLLRPARVTYHASVIMTICSSAYLLYLIITHQFDFTYVWSYSSRELPFNLLISTFYAGQEGSFHLFAFMVAVQGIFLLSFLTARDKQYELNNHTSNKDIYEPIVMTVYASIQMMLLSTLILKSPYLRVWESFPGEVQAGFVPEDGRGLNPLLQNFWMTIHPPILFMGFAALAIPFCFAVAALIKNNYQKWMKLALPWTLYSGMILGLGIMLGGYWAYGVLGWGGYWGWDPVENSSFVPWIVIIAAIHTLVAEEKTGKFKKMSLVLCILGFILVLYSTFLTRSGILGDASVHSFVDPGQEVYIFLVVFLGTYLLLGLGLVLYRLKSLKSPAKETSEMLSRESALFIGAATLCACALVIAVGTSWPLIAKGTVDPAFYNKMNLPLAIFIAAVNGISILLAWKHTDSGRFKKSLFMPLVITAIAAIALAIFAVRDVLILALAAASIFAFAINLQLILRLISNKAVKAGPYIAHLGIMVLFLGIIGSSKYSVEENLSLPIDEPKQALGYTLTYKGATPIKNEIDEKYHFNVIVEKEGKGYLLQPIMFYSDYSDGIMKNPDIANLVVKDIYIEPLSLETGSPYTEQDIVSFEKGKEVEVKGVKVKFIDFDRSKFDNEKMMSGEENIIGATLEVTINDKKQTVVAEQSLSGGNAQPLPVHVHDGDKHITFYLTQVSVGDAPVAQIAVSDIPEGSADSQKETLVLTASIKPLINLVWGGTIIMVIGFIVSLISRRNAFLSKLKPVQHHEHHEHHPQSNGNGSSNGHGTGGHHKEYHKTHHD